MLKGGGKLKAKLAEIQKKVAKANTVQVGFLSGSTYPDANHTPVAMVAAIQEYGAPRASIPPRPFFRSMIESKKGNWGKSLAAVLKNNDYDVEKSLSLMGEGIGSQLVESIKQTNSPALSPITLMLRKMRSEDQSLVVTGAVVGEAARRVAAGEDYSGTATKPLVDSGHLIHSVGYQVDAGEKTLVPGD